MATTMYLDHIFQDKGGAGEALAIEAGTSSYYDGIPQLYLTINDRTVILDDENGRRLCEAFADIARYLGSQR